MINENYVLERSAAENITPEMTWTESLGAAFDIGEQSTFSTYLRRYRERNEIEKNSKRLDASPEQTVKVSAEQLNEQYPYLEEKFTQPTTIEVANFIAKKQLEKMRLSSIIQRGPQNWGMTAANFLSTSAAHVVDPYEFGAGMLAGAGLGLLARSAAAGAFGARGAQVGIAMMNRPILTGMLGDVIGNAAVEPVMYYGAKEDHETYDMTDVALSVVAAPVMMSGLKYGASKMFRYLRSRGGQLAAEANSTAMMQSELGKTVDLENMIDRSVKDAFSDKGIEYSYSPITRENLSGREFFAAGSTIQKTEPINMIDVDGVIHLTDNQNIAHGTTTSANGTGAIQRVSLVDANLLDADMKIDSKLDADLKKVTGFEADTLQEYISKLDDSGKSEAFIMQSKEQVFEALKRNGYDGYHYRGDNPLSEFRGDIAPHNGAILFDESKIKVEEVAQARKSSESVQGQQSAMISEMERIASPRSDVFHSEEASLMMSELSPERNVDFDVSTRTKDLITRRDEGLERLSNLDQKGKLEAGVKSELDAVMKERQEAELEAEVMKASIFCMGD